MWHHLDAPGAGQIVSAACLRLTFYKSAHCSQTSALWMSCIIIIICFCCSPHRIKMPRFTNRYRVENSSSSTTASWKLEMVENSQASWLGSHKSPIAKVTISEQDEKVGCHFFALILLQQILFSSVSFHVFLPVVEYNQLLHSWGVPICVPLAWSSMIADGVVGRVKIRKHTETHAETPS